MEFGLESLPMLLVIAFCIFLLGNDGGDGDSIDDGSGGDDGDDDVINPLTNISCHMTLRVVCASPHLAKTSNIIIIIIIIIIKL